MQCVVKFVVKQNLYIFKVLPYPSIFDNHKMSQNNHFV